MVSVLLPFTTSTIRKDNNDIGELHKKESKNIRFHVEADFSFQNYYMEGLYTT